MKLPDPCPLARRPFSEFAESGVERSDCCRNKDHAWLLGREDPLCRSRPTEEEVYRFIWDSSFHGNAVVRIARKGEAIALRWKYECYRLPAANDAPPLMALSAAEWERLQQALTAANFWSLEVDNRQLGFDGAQWLIEGRRKDTYHAICRWSPGGEVYELGQLFFSLSRPPLAEVKLY